MYDMNKWQIIKKQSDLLKLPLNRYAEDYSANVLVSSTNNCMNEVYLMYFDFTDSRFHFPSYSITWCDLKLKPIEEINRWMSLPKKPKLSGKN